MRISDWSSDVCSSDLLEVSLFVPSANVISLARNTGLQHAANGTTVVFYIQPVTDLLAIAINWQRLTRQSVQDHQRNQFFGEMIRPIVIGAVSGNNWQKIGRAHV